MSRRPRSEPKTVGAVLPGVLRDLGLGEAALGVRLAEAWAQLAGADAAAHSWPAGLRGGVLEVEVDSSVWAQQLQLRRPELLRALRAFLAEDATPSTPPLRDLRLRVGRAGGGVLPPAGALPPRGA
jgi:predicted nucleic acid-binding Zn ribbon protein